MSKYRVINQMPAVVNKTAKSVDINLYGPVIDAAGWFTDENAVVTPGKVQSVLNDVGNVSQVNVHINSPGGSVFAGQAIYNMLRQHPANITVYVDGLAASVASIIAMAGDKIVMPPGAMMMIHNPLVNLWGAYQADDCREMAGFLDKVKESLVATYAARCTKKTKDEIVALMDATTWLTANDAIDMGFADEIVGGTVNAGMTGKVLNVAGMAFDLSMFATIPAHVAACVSQEQKEEEGFLDTKELKAKSPDLYNEIFNLGVERERGRIKALDDIQLPGHDGLVNKAKYETGATAEQVALEIIAAEKATRCKAMTDLEDDAENSGANGISDAVPPATDDEAERKTMAQKIADGANERRM